MDDFTFNVKDDEAAITQWKQFVPCAKSQEGGYEDRCCGVKMRAAVEEFCGALYRGTHGNIDSVDTFSDELVEAALGAMTTELHPLMLSMVPMTAQFVWEHGDKIKPRFNFSIKVAIVLSATSDDDVDRGAAH